MLINHSISLIIQCKVTKDGAFVYVQVPTKHFRSLRATQHPKFNEIPFISSNSALQRAIKRDLNDPNHLFVTGGHVTAVTNESQNSRNFSSPPNDAP